MTQITTNETAEILRSYDNYLILTHIRPDGDTLGSAAALCSMLRRIGKTAYLIDNPDTIEKFIPYVTPYIAPEGFRADTVISVDIADEKLMPKGDYGPILLSIDHHPSNSGYAAKTHLRPECAACSEIVTDIMHALDTAPTAAEADLLYIALSTDTGCFQYGNTTANSFRCAAELTDAGANITELNRVFFRTFSKARLTLEGLIYSNLLSYMDNKINIALVTKEMVERAGATDDDTSDMASLPGRVAGNLISATIKENREGHSKVSLRSVDVNVSEICKKFGGGGHVMAAGCEIPLPPAEAAEALRPLLENALK